MEGQKKIGIFFFNDINNGCEEVIMWKENNVEEEKSQVENIQKGMNWLTLDCK